MNRSLVTAFVIGIVAGCGSSGSTASPGPATMPGATTFAASVQPSVSPSVTPTVFQTDAFADLSDDPVPVDAAARYEAALTDAFYIGGGLTATVMTPDGTWSGAFGKADGVHDMDPDSQFGIGSGTKPIVAAQVMRLVEEGEISLDRPATDYLPADFSFDTNGAIARPTSSVPTQI